MLGDRTKICIFPCFGAAEGIIILCLFFWRERDLGGKPKQYEKSLRKEDRCQQHSPLTRKLKDFVYTIYKKLRKTLLSDLQKKMTLRLNKVQQTHKLAGTLI